MADASFPNERTRGTYFPQNWQPLRRSGQLELVDGDQSLAVGVRTLTVPGHTESIQAVWVEDGGESLLFLGDACSWAAHLDRIAWVPSFDLYPMRSIESKRALRLQAEEKNALLVFQHDGQVVTGGCARARAARWCSRRSPKRRGRKIVRARSDRIRALYSIAYFVLRMRWRNVLASDLSSGAGRLCQPSVVPFLSRFMQQFVKLSNVKACRLNSSLCWLWLRKRRRLQPKSI